MAGTRLETRPLGTDPARPHLNKTCDQCGTAYIADSRSWRKSRFCSKKCWEKAKYPKRKIWGQQNLEHMREYRNANRLRINAHQMEYYYADHENKKRERRKAFQRFRTARPWAVMVRNARARASKKWLAFDLTDEWAQARWTGRCELTNLPFEIGSPKADPRAFSPTIDRIDCSRGYTQDNCRFILHAVNALKGEVSDNIMLKIASELLTNYPKKELQ